MRLIWFYFALTLAKASGQTCYTVSTGARDVIRNFMNRESEVWWKSLEIVPSRNGFWKLVLLVLLHPASRLMRLNLEVREGQMTLLGFVQEDERPVSGFEAFPYSERYFSANKTTGMQILVTRSEFKLKIFFEGNNHEWTVDLSPPADLNRNGEFHLWNDVNAEDFAISFDCVRPNISSATTVLPSTTESVYVLRTTTQGPPPCVGNYCNVTDPTTVPIVATTTTTSLPAITEPGMIKTTPGANGTIDEFGGCVCKTDSTWYYHVIVVLLIIIGALFLGITIPKCQEKCNSSVSPDKQPITVNQATNQEMMSPRIHLNPAPLPPASLGSGSYVEPIMPNSGERVHIVHVNGEPHIYHVADNTIPITWQQRQASSRVATLPEAPLPYGQYIEPLSFTPGTRLHPSVVAGETRLYDDAGAKSQYRSSPGEQQRQTSATRRGSMESGMYVDTFAPNAKERTYTVRVNGEEHIYYEPNE